MDSSPVLLAASYTLVITAYDLNTGSFRADYEIQNSQANRLVARRGETCFFAAGYSYVLQYDLQKKGRKASQNFVAHEGNVTDLDLTPTMIVTAGDDKTLKTWDRRKSYQSEVVIRTQSANNCVQILPSGAPEIIAGNEAGFLELYDLRSSGLLCAVKMTDKPIRSLAVPRDSLRIIAAAQDGKTSCYSAEGDTLTEQYRIQAHNDIQLRTVVSPDGKSFATTAANNSARVWDMENGDLRQSLASSDERVWIWDAAFTSDSAKLCTGGSDGICRMFDCENGRMEMTFPAVDKCISCLTILYGN
jgi:G protein beta subunit-like protein